MTSVYKVLDFFSGNGSVAKVARSEGYDVWSTDIRQFGEITHVEDILAMDLSVIPHNPLVAWFSPPCEAFSVASISHHWTGGKEAYLPKSAHAMLSIRLVERSIEIIEAINPKHWYIENPRGVLRKLLIMEFAPFRQTVTYCQYGDSRMKPTDIWTNNLNWQPRPVCKNGDPCHEAAPRGSRTGTQGGRSYLERSHIPSDLVKEILEASK